MIRQQMDHGAYCVVWPVFGALRLQNQAFVAERESWQMERDRMHRRIVALEALLKSPNGQRYFPSGTPETKTWLTFS